MTSLDIIFAGAGEFGLSSLNALTNAGHRIVQVISQPDRPAGRGRKLTPTPIAQYAIEHNFPLIRTDNINTETLPPADLLVVIAFGQKIAEHTVHHARLGAVNLHSSRLPKFRGAAPINAAILAGETITGNSVIRLAQKMDAGAIVGQSELPIGELETAGELHDRLAEDGAKLLLDVVEKLATRTATEIEQDHSQATLAKKLSRESTRIDWSKPAKEIAIQIRGLYPWPGCRVQLMDGEKVVDRLTLVRARSGRAEGPPCRRAPGTIALDGTINTGDGALEIVEVQPEGKRPMPLAAYRNGHPWDPGMRLESIA
jgi:methionyl-tRNA formyltransferase